jgi:Tc5 transposase DNA-binding domain/DDE superfamily endonuclease
MDPIDEAIEEIESLEPCETFSYMAIAKKYGVVRTTLMRRHKGITASRTTRISNTQKLNPQQEAELVKYIEGLTARRLQPTREMVRNFASAIAKQDVGKNWVTRFIARHKNNIESHWTAGMDRDRHRADSGHKYQLFFQLLHDKIEEYKIQPQHSYNMDEKGFLIGIIGRSKRIFSKAMWDSKEVREALQDGNREWITLLACICGDGSSLPPGLLFASANSSIQSSWVEGVRAGKHEAFISSSLNGWSNNDIGLAWLEQVFDRYTKEKAQKDRRAWRLLILDGHGFNH